MLLPVASRLATSGAQAGFSGAPVTPWDLAGCIIGKQGESINRIQRESEAKCVPRPGKNMM